MTGRNGATARTGIAGLDDVLGGGFPRNHIYVVQGSPGAGKTTLGLQFLLSGRVDGETGLYVSLSETEQELSDVAVSHGWPLDGIAVQEVLTAGDSEGERDNTLFHPAEIELGETTRAIFQRVETLGEIRKAISVVKKRSGRHESTIRELAMDDKGLRIGPPLKDFQGVLTGIPAFAGASGSLLQDRDGRSDR